MLSIDEFSRLGRVSLTCFVIPESDPIHIPTPNAPIKVWQLEAVPLMASTLATDGFYKKPGGLLAAYNALAQWSEENGSRLAGAPRELFYGSVANGDLTAEVQFPVEKV